MSIDAAKKILSPARSSRLYVGFSGGADSTALLLLALSAQKELDLDLAAVHFEHGLRGQPSLDDALFCENFARERDVEFIRIDLKIPPGTPGMEAEARRLRQKHFSRLVAERPGFVALGHHADDQVENFFLRACRGGNASGLTGLRERREVGGVVYLRPLLAVTRNEIEDFLRSQGVSAWRSDQSNFDNSIARNTVRNRVLPALSEVMPFARRGLRKSLSALQQDAEYIELDAEREFSAGRKTGAMNRVSWWRNLHPAVLVRVLRRFLSQNSAAEIIPDAALIAGFSELIASNSTESRTLPLGGGLKFIARGDELALIAAPDSHVDIIWDWRNSPCEYGKAELVPALPPLKDISPCEAFFDADDFPGVLRWTSRRDGDVMTVYGGGSAKVKKLVIDAKLPVARRASLRLLRDLSGRILWIPEVRRSDIAPVTDKTLKIVRISIANSPK